MLAWVVTVTGGAGCDSGPAPLSLGPRLRIVSYEPRPSEGLDCEPDQPGCGFPIDRPLRFVFDRWLRPNTATRQSIAVNLVSTGLGVFWEPTYDLVTRTIIFRPAGGWDQGYVFDLRLYDPTSPDAAWGFRTYDNLKLDPSGIPAHILFRVGPPAGQAPDADPRVHTSCHDALQAFASAGCAAANCHSSSGVASAVAAPRAGLALDGRAGLAAMIGQVARATDRGGESGIAWNTPERFGVNLALVESGEPAMSLVMYRMLLGRDAYRDRNGNVVVPPPTDAELERARSWFGVSSEMPPPEVGWSAEVSPIDAVRTIQRWIWDGASTDDCD